MTSEQQAGSLALRLAPYAVHLSHCHFDSWKARGAGKNRRFVSCDCGLFQLLLDAGYEEQPDGR